MDRSGRTLEGNREHEWETKAQTHNSEWLEEPFCYNLTQRGKRLSPKHEKSPGDDWEHQLANPSDTTQNSAKVAGQTGFRSHSKVVSIPREEYGIEEKQYFKEYLCLIHSKVAKRDVLEGLI